MMLVNCNWTLGWVLILLGIISGALMGLFFHRKDFLGGYDAWPRRLVRLGHIAFMALGILNLIYAVGPHPAMAINSIISAALIFSSVTMPLVCLLAAWRGKWAFLFVFPVLALALTCVLAFWSSL